MNSERFKWSVVLASLLMTSIPVSIAAQVIYGLDNARHFNTHQSGPYFIQAGSFRSASYANTLKHQLASRTHYPVQIKSSGSNHTVRIGPFTSVAEVHSFASGKPIPKMTHTAPRPIAKAAPALQRSHKKPMPVRSAQHSHSSPPPVINFSSGVTAKPGVMTKKVVIANGNATWYVGMNAGLIQTKMSKANLTVPNGSDFPPPENVDQYSLKQHRPAIVDLQAGRRWQRNQPWLPSYAIGFRYQHLFTKNIEGTVTQYSLPEFTNYNYRWGVGADTLSLYSKINVVQYARFMPYVDLGIGVSNTQSKTYDETALGDVTPRFSPDYAAKRKAQLTYNLGAGLDFILTPNILISAGYAYQSFGKLSSGAGQGPDWSGTHLSLGHLNTNAGLIGFTYLFETTKPNSDASYK